LPPRDFDFRKRPIGNSGAFFGYVAILGGVINTRASIIWQRPNSSS
jgi:hypothetical protein